MVNIRAWQSLPDHYKHILEQACTETMADMMARYEVANPQALRRLVAGVTQLRAWPRGVMQAAWRPSHELYEETSAQNPRFRRMWESYRRFRDDRYQWFRVAGNSFENFAYPAAAAR